MATAAQASSSNLRKRKALPSPSSEVPDNDEAVGVKIEEEERTPNALKPDALKLWTTVNELKDASGYEIAVVYRKLPSKRQYPEYYQIIRRPMALEEIKSNIHAGQYNTLTAVRDDMLLVFRNAMRYNVKDSQIWTDAKYLKKHLLDTFDIMMGRVKEPEIKKPKRSYTLVKWNFRVLRLLNEITDTDGRHRLEIFQELPAREEYPDYYVLIKQPISVKDIKKKINRRQYDALDEFVQDVKTMFSNAIFFNEEGSQVHEDATILDKALDSILAEAPTEFEPPTAEELGHTNEDLKKEASHDEESKGSKSTKSLKLHLPSAQAQNSDPPLKITMSTPAAGKIKIKTASDEPKVATSDTASKDRAKVAPLPKIPSLASRPAADSTIVDNSAISNPNHRTSLPTMTNGQSRPTSQQPNDKMNNDMTSSAIALIDHFTLTSRGTKYDIRVNEWTRSHAIAIARGQEDIRLTVYPSEIRPDVSRRSGNMEIEEASISVWTNGMITPSVVPGQGPILAAAEAGMMHGTRPSDQMEGSPVTEQAKLHAASALNGVQTTDLSHYYSIRLGKGLTVVEVEATASPASMIPGLSTNDRPTVRYRIFINQV